MFEWRKNKMKKINKLKKLLILIIIILVSFTSKINAKELSLISEKYIMYNLNDNKVILKKDENDKTQIASLTKIMTVLVAVENIEDYNTKIVITKDMIKDIKWDVAKIGLKEGQTVTYDDLLYCTMLPSAADCANGLAISIAGNYDKYVEMMNNKAASLKLQNTRFANPVGLYDEKNYSTASDVAKMLNYALKSKKFKQIFEMKEYTMSTGKKIKSTLMTYNKKVSEDISYITGAKTGYIKLAGNCLASTATINGVNYMLVTLNAYSTQKSPHILDATTAYKYFYENFSYKTILNKNDVIVTLNAKNSKEKRISIHHDKEYKYYLGNDFKKENVTYEYDGIKEVSYFTKKGTILGKVKIKYNNETLKEFTLYFNETLHFSLLSFLCSNIIYIILIVFFLIIILSIFKKSKGKRKNNKRR